MPWQLCHAQLMLEALGLTDAEATVYRHLLVASGSTVPEIASMVGLGSQRVQRVLAQLEEKGLVSRGPGRNPQFSIPPPELALEALVARREEEIKRARLEIDALLRDLPTEQARHGGLPPVDLVEGLDAARQRWVQIQRSAQAEVCIIDRPPHVLTATAPNPVELELLPRGIAYRVLYDEASLDVPGKLDAAKACMAAGEDARVSDEVPLKLVMADATIALTYDVQGQEIRDGLVVHPSPLLDALVKLFNLLWDKATPLGSSLEPGQTAHELDELDQTILVLLAAGAQDETMARRLGVAVRTVRRRVSHLMQILNAKTRFQAAVRAKERGWI